jgi:hypothetical protein
MFDNKKIQKIINIVIVEFANIDYQDILDKFIFGEEVDINELRKVWRESTQSPGRLGEIPVYFKLLQKIRNVNLTLPAEKKIRVMGGDPSIHWDEINTWDDCKKEIGSSRDIFPADLAIDFGINNSKKVLLIYSGFHLTKVSDKSIASFTITSAINKRSQGAIKVIEVLNPEAFPLETKIKDLALYSIINLSTSQIGNMSAEKLFTSIFNQKGEKLTLFSGLRTKDLFDAFLFVGLAESWKIAEIPKSVLYDSKYWNELNRRRKIVGMQPLDESLKH